MASTPESITDKLLKCAPTERMDKQNEIYTYSGILFSLKKEGESDTCCILNEPVRHLLIKIDQSQKYTMCYDSIHI